MNRIIEITVSPKGESRLETKGFAGSHCRTASRALQESLGHVLQERLTAEFCVAPTVSHHEQQRQ